MWSSSGRRSLACVALTLAHACGNSPETNQPDLGPRNPGDAAATDGGAVDVAADVVSSDPIVDAGAPDRESERGAATTDAAPEAAPRDAGTSAAIESIAVQANAPASFKTSLVAGASYLLKATGSVDVGGRKQDAEFEFAPDQTTGTDMIGAIDVGIDVGLLELHPMNHTTMVPPGPGRMKWFGSFRADHVYYASVTGAGKPLTLKLVTSGAGGSGAIAVSLFELGPPPPAVYASMPAPVPPPPAPPSIGTSALETVQVPLAKTVAAGRVPTDLSAVYLLQASSVGQVSRGTVTPTQQHMGDAEYMDWPADGSKFNDGECGADFGIGVDEIGGPAPCTGGAMYPHRARWWGPYRNDHVYYMLFAGTGNPISFLYFDSGYGDNSMTDTVTVRIFPAP